MALSIVLSGDDPPSEFRIFTAGKVETTKGTFIFDDEAAQSVLAEHAKHGTELMLDYDHASLDVGIDPALSGRAAGWFDIELRNGELWAVNVRWTPAAAEALRNKEWRYMSPAFGLSGDRISKLLNVALTNLPATRGLEPLMAASRRGNVIMANDSGLNSKLVNQALEAVASKDAKAALDLMKQILAALLGGTPEDTAPSDGGGDAAPMDPAAAAASIAASIERFSTMQSASQIVLKLAGKPDLVAALAELKRRSEIALDIEAREAKLSSDRKALEINDRRALVGTIVKLGYEIPALAWADEAGTVPSDDYAAMPLDRLRDRVEKLTAAGPRAGAPLPPSGGTGATADGGQEFQTPLGTVKLSQRELAMCVEMKLDPKNYAATKAGKKKG